MKAATRNLAIKALTNLVSSPIPPIKDRAKMFALEHDVHERLYDAYEAPEEERTRTLVDIVTQMPFCVDAITTLTQDLELPAEEALVAYDWAERAGRSFLGTEFFLRERGNFWGLLDTRSYMRALLNKAETLAQLGRFEEAADCGLEMRSLNTSDNCGVREKLGLWFLLGGDMSGYRRYAKRSLDESDGEWPNVLTRAFAMFLESHNKGSKAIAKAVIVPNRGGDDTAHQPNQDAISLAKMCIDRDPLAVERQFAEGSPMEMLYTLDAWRAWRENPDAVACLVSALQSIGVDPQTCRWPHDVQMEKIQQRRRELYGK